MEDEALISITHSNVTSNISIHLTTISAFSTTTGTVEADNSEWLVERIDFYLSGIILLIICILGIVSNILVVIVLTHKSMKSSTNSFLLALALSDSVVLVCSILMLSLHTLSNVYDLLVYPHIIAYIYPFALIAQTCNIWITVSFTVERYIAIKHPLRASSMCTIKRARLTIVGITLISILYNISRWFEYRSVQNTSGFSNTTTEAVHIPDTNFVSYRVAETWLAKNESYERIYFTGLYLTFMCILPVMLLSVLNYFLIQVVSESNKMRKSMGNNTMKDDKENNITLMLVSVVVVFIICQVPALVYNFAYGVAKKDLQNSVYWRVLSIVRNFLVTVNSAVNFLLYCAFGQKFRRVFLRIFCNWSQKHVRGSSRYRSTTTNTSVVLPMLDRNYNTVTTCLAENYHETEDVKV